METQDTNTIKLDYTLDTEEERKDLVNKILESIPSEKLTNKYLTILADYLLFLDKRQKDYKILTENRKTTINRRETSFEGLVAVFDSKYNESGGGGNEDSIYNIITDNKNIILTPKISISPDEVEEIPGMKELQAEIARLKEVLPQAKGKAKYSIKQNIIALCKDQYVLRASFKGPINCINATKTISKIDLDEKITINQDNELEVEANISLLIPQHVSAILCNYSALKASCHSKFESDMYYLLLVLEDTVDKALADYPLYYDLLVYKIDGKQNTEIQKELEETFGIKYSVEHLSSLWRNKIPKLIAEQAQKDYLEYYYTNVKKGNWKRCSRCGQIKLAHTKFFSKNKTSKDGFYSICKDCRNKKVGSVKD